MFCTSGKFRKFECGTRDENPTRSEIQRCLGVSLAQVLFDYSHQEAVKLLDLTSLTKLSQQSCCVSQNSRLKDRAETWARKQQTLKSYLHSEILALGEDELKKFQTQIEAATQKKLKDEFAEKYRWYEAEIRFAIRRNADDIHSKYEEYFKFAQQELKKKLQIELNDSDAKRKEEPQKADAKIRMDTIHHVLRKIRPQMNLVVTSLYSEFEQTCRAQKEEMITDFNKAIRKQHLEQNAKIKEIETKKMEELRIHCNKLKIRNARNIIYMFCMERLRYSSQLEVIHKHLEEKIKSLHELIVMKEEIINEMKETITKYCKENKILQENINALTEEFQKFINFAFNTLPEHADFLLPLDLLSINSTNKEDTKQEKCDK